MKAKLLLLIAGLVVVGLAGCEDDEVDVARDAESPTTAEDVQREVGEAIGAAGEYFGEKKDEFLADSQDELDTLEARFAELKERGAEAAGQADEELADLRVEVSEKLARAKEELQDLKQAGGDAWDEALSDFRSAMEDLQEAYQNYTTYEPNQTEEGVARG
jgi:chromosome segregation ATPase